MAAFAQRMRAGFGWAPAAPAVALLLALLASFALLGGGAAHAHELSMAEMDVRQMDDQHFTWVWTASGERPAAQALQAVWPEGCQADANTLVCKHGLRGRLSVQGVGKRYSAAMIRVHWLQGQSRVYTLTPAQSDVQLYGGVDDSRGMSEIAWAYLVLGVEHILTGLDHLLFVIGLLFLVGFNKRLVATITAFTVAHSLTLALSALGWLVLRPPPVEATIAISIVLVASEALHQRQTWSRRWPALVAFLFGLVHGLGFAGALKEIGLPDQHLAVALLTFNVGVEGGQLLVLALAGLLVKVLPRSGSMAPRLGVARTVALYGMGSLAACWSIQRAAAVFLA